MAKPVLYLDVDGVLFADSGEHQRDPQSRKLQVEIDSGYRMNVTVRYDAAMAARMAALLDAGELVWLTTWQAMAPRMVAPLVGFGGEARWIDATGHRKLSDSSSMAWKRRAHATIWAAAPHPFIWVDDEHGFHADSNAGDVAADLVRAAVGWGDLAVAEGAQVHVPPFLLIRTNGTYGLDDDEIAGAVHFARHPTKPPKPATATMLHWPGGAISL